MNPDSAARLRTLVEQGERAPTTIAASRADGDALALEIEGELALRWRIAVVRAAMADPPDGDAVRELYGELIDRYRDDPAGLALLRPIGDQIRELEAAGTLPSAMVARSERRKRP